MYGLENKAEVKQRAKRLEGYMIRYDKLAKQRTRLIYQTEHIKDTATVSVDEETQTQVSSSEIALCTLYMDSHGNLCSTIPAQSGLLRWVSLRVNSCTPLLLSVHNILVRSKPMVHCDNNDSTNHLLTKVQTNHGSSIQIPNECIVLCPPPPFFIESLHYLLVKLQLYTATVLDANPRMIGEVVARPFTFNRNMTHKDRQFTQISDIYPIVFDSEVVGSLCLRLEMLSHDHTIETTRHFTVDCFDFNKTNQREKRRLISAQTQTTGYLTLTLEERWL
ncbi:Hypothetical protein GLP15_3772 [Giardia lamblia P15]|uniref:Uncharacterized protein n=1 Tax=Giardia intestinalis (strain P15) TaxID=658858 RepID=E1F299_GIAIA|nr:Hypothetical protein GLP15_3772 [Giardia lamblia P15]